jgi:hypothetical protein
VYRVQGWPYDPRDFLGNSSAIVEMEIAALKNRCLAAGSLAEFEKGTVGSGGSGRAVHTYRY